MGYTQEWSPVFSQLTNRNSTTIHPLTHTYVWAMFKHGQYVLLVIFTRYFCFAPLRFFMSCHGVSLKQNKKLVAVVSLLVWNTLSSPVYEMCYVNEAALPCLLTITNPKVHPYSIRTELVGFDGMAAKLLTRHHISNRFQVLLKKVGGDWTGLGFIMWYWEKCTVIYSRAVARHDQGSSESSKVTNTVTNSWFSVFAEFPENPSAVPNWSLHPQ